eukprot:5623784-Pyramimonas_sp.AAC.1
MWGQGWAFGSRASLPRRETRGCSLSLVGPPASQPGRCVVWSEVATVPSVRGHPTGRGVAGAEGMGAGRGPREHAPDALH